jgi:hypothetical protein
MKELGRIHNDVTFKSMMSTPDWIEQLSSRAKSAGLAVRGACHLRSGEFEHPLLSRQLSTVLLLGFTGSAQWPVFAASAEVRDGLPNPLDRWSRRTIGALALECCAHAIYPSDVPTLPFQQLARRSESVFPSPIGLLISDEWGLWHAYRGALVFPEHLPLPEPVAASSPCIECQGQPCLSTCPVEAFGLASYNLEACVQHVANEQGRDCQELGCRARRACPVGVRFRYLPEQAQFHIDAFIRACQPETGIC